MDEDKIIIFVDEETISPEELEENEGEDVKEKEC